MTIISTPEHSQPIYLCRFAVRSLDQLARGFSSQCGISLTRLPQVDDMLIILQGYVRADLPTRTLFVLNLEVHTPSKPTLLRLPITKMLSNGTGILTRFPSPTPIGLGLGVD